MIPQDEPHEWSTEALLNKAQSYVEEMLSFSYSDWQFALWSTLSLELLARAALSAYSPVLLANPQNWNNLLHALEIGPKAPSFRASSINISSVLERLQELIPDYTPELAGFCKGHIERRNEELHSGATPFVGTGNIRWLPRYYRACEVLLESLGTSLADFLGKERASVASDLISTQADESAKSVNRKVRLYEEVWNDKDSQQKARLSLQASTWATRQTGHRVSCPACKSDAIVSGKPISVPIQNISGDEITETLEYLPTVFECVACQLKISGLSNLIASGLGEAYKATFTYDAYDLFLPDDDYGGYEPDFNEP